jgi:hypothetical protein
MQCPVIELRQYTLHPGQRDVLIELFDREFVESQEATGMAILGQFRDLDNADRFVWMRGFSDMPARAESLAAFYGGPAWKAHRDQANATMVDSDNVLLLRPATGDPGFPALPPRDTPAAPSLVLATVYYRDRPFDDEFIEFFNRELRPLYEDAGATPLACFQTEYAQNTFPALPVRTGEHVFVWFAHFADAAGLAASLEATDSLPVVSKMITGAPHHLRLAPTSRSLIR